MKQHVACISSLPKRERRSPGSFRSTWSRKKFVFGTMKGLLNPEDEKALLAALEAPLPEDVLASFHIGRLKSP